MPEHEELPVPELKKQGMVIREQGLESQKQGNEETRDQGIWRRILQ